MNKNDLKNRLQAAAYSVNEEEKLEELANRVELLENCPVFSKVAISVERFKLKDCGEEKLVVTLKELLTNKTFRLSLYSILTLPKAIKDSINPNGVLNSADFGSIQNVAELLSELTTDATIVDEYPILDEELSSQSYKALYASFIEDLVSGAISVTASPENFSDEDYGYKGLLCNNFRQSGNNVILLSAEDLKSAIDIEDVTEFKSVMRCWRKENMLFVTDSAKKAGRLQIKHRILNTSKYSWYAIVVPRDVTIDTDI